eukprot:2862835-Pleurochrysis_carterae.AAC.1
MSRETVPLICDTAPARSCSMRPGKPKSASMSGESREKRSMASHRALKSVTSVGEQHATQGC